MADNLCGEDHIHILYRFCIMHIYTVLANPTHSKSICNMGIVPKNSKFHQKQFLITL